MTRRDTILLAVIVNAGLLAVLFVTAVIYDPYTELNQSDIKASVNTDTPALVDSNVVIPPPPIESTGDEMDNVLSYYANPSQPIIVETNPEIYSTEPSEIPSEDKFAKEMAKIVPEQSDFLEVTVKKGDVLEKIAKANGTTVSAIKKANQLKNERLQIGQVLKIPKKEEKSTIAAATTAASQANKKNGEKSEKETSSDAVYYTIKGGDSPWKVARQFNVKYEDILRLNGLDEEKARNLKVGDKIQIK